MDEIESAIDGAIHAQVDDDAIDVTFESGADEPSGLMKAWEIGEHRAELRYLRRPDTDEPFSSPWHVKVIGPDPLAGGRVDSKWSASYKERDSAEGAAVGKLRDKHRKTQRREENRPRQAIDAAIHRKCGCSNPRGKKKDEDKYDYKAERGQTIDADDVFSPAEECEPLLTVELDVEEDIGIPEKRLKLEEGIADAVGYINRRVFTAVRGGPAVSRNFAAVIKLSPAETWDSMDRSVDRMIDWLESEGWIEDASFDASITLEAGDADIIAREYEEGFSR